MPRGKPILIELDRRAIGERIRSRAKRRYPWRGWLRSLSRLTGIPWSTLVTYVIGRRLPSVRNVVAIARALRCTADWLLSGHRARPQRGKGTPDAGNGKPTDDNAG